MYGVMSRIGFGILSCLMLCSGCYTEREVSIQDRSSGDPSKDTSELRTYNSTVLNDRFVLFETIVGSKKGAIVASSFSFYSDGMETIGLQVIDLQSGKVRRVFEKPVWIHDWSIAVTPRGTDFGYYGTQVSKAQTKIPSQLLMAVTPEDTDGDGAISAKDRETAFVYHLETGEKSEIVPAGYEFNTATEVPGGFIFVLNALNGQGAAVYRYDMASGEGRFVAEGLKK